MNREIVRALSRWLASALLFVAASVGVSAQTADVERLALKGYDPVAYFTLSRAAPGDPRFQMEWDGAVYRFVSTGHLAQFRADPDRYLPQYGNLCTASLAGGRKYAPDPRYWLVHEGRLYLFGHPDGVKTMAANPEAVKAQANANLGQMSRPVPR
jgi:YHS domain-containing protein